MATHSFIIFDTVLWGKTKLLDFGFLLPGNPSAPPGIVLLFSEGEPARSIFKGWKALIGDDDPNDILRVVIAEGKHPKKGIGYALGLGVNAENIPTVGQYDDVATIGTNRFKLTDGDKELQRFKESIARNSTYLLVPGARNTSTNKTTVWANEGLRKTGLTIRTFASIERGEADHPLFF